jgi:hypothetical protein
VTSTSRARWDAINETLAEVSRYLAEPESAIESGDQTPPPKSGWVALVKTLLAKQRQHYDENSPEAVIRNRNKFRQEQAERKRRGLPHIAHIPPDDSPEWDYMKPRL